MKQYLLSVYPEGGDAPSPEVMEKIFHDVGALNTEIQAAGEDPRAGRLELLVPGADLAHDRVQGLGRRLDPVGLVDAEQVLRHVRPPLRRAGRSPATRTARPGIDTRARLSRSRPSRRPR